MDMRYEVSQTYDTGNWKLFAVRAELITDIRLQPTGPCDRLCYGVRRSRRALAKPGECEKNARVLMRGPHRRQLSSSESPVTSLSKKRLYYFSANAPQTRCSDQAMEAFWSPLDEKTAEAPTKDIVIVIGDLNGHIGAAKDGHSCHGGFGYGSVTPIIDFVLVKTELLSLTRRYETVVPQHRPLICTFKITPPRLQQLERCGAARIKWWRMKEKEAAVISRVQLPTFTIVSETRKRATDMIR
ncbi:unnamed protein product [Heligmosomoides polygyrus]|uniref:Craniofacial development protein 2-like n=1 Tax=Heligmosomoides polygyrus TaxID=6339 RepID=A0A183GL03_HELPZ|nr:unnamed protein product [Heligmosomoides polygyrus]